MIGWASLLVVGYGIYAAALFFMQTRLMFPRHLIADPGEPTVEQQYGIERFWVETGDGDRVEAWYAKGRMLDGPVNQPRPLVVHAHGNAELIDDHLNRMLNYQELGVNCLMVEYRGYGRSGGTPSQESLVADVESALAVVLARPEVDGSKLIYHGRSIGGGVLCALAERRAPSAMILESCFTSVPAMTRRFAVPGFLVRSPFRNDSVVKGFEGPILFFHGSRDEIIPVEHSRELVAMAKRGELIEKEAGHNDFPPNFSEYWYDIEKWLRERSGAW